MAAHDVSAVLQLGVGDPVGLAAQVVAGPPPGGHDQRVHPAELGGERLVQQPLAGRAAVLGVGAGAPHQGVVGGGRAGHVHPVDVRVVGQVRTHLGAALDDGQPAGVDELDEEPLQRRAQVGVDRVELHHDRAAVPEQQREGVHGRQVGAVAGRQQQGDTRVRELPGSPGRRRPPPPQRRGAGLQADPARVAHEQQPVGARLREHLHRDLALRVLAHGIRRHEALVAGQPGQGRLPAADQDRQAGRGPPTRHPPSGCPVPGPGPPARPRPCPAPRRRRAGAADAPTRPSPPPAGRPTTAARPAPCPRRHPAPRHPLLRPSDSRSSRSPRPCWPGPRARGAPLPTQPPEAAAAVGADVPRSSAHPDAATAGRRAVRPGRVHPGEGTATG